MKNHNCPVCKELPFDNIACPEALPDIPPMSAEAATALTRIMNEIIAQRLKGGPFPEIMPYSEDDLDFTGYPFDPESDDE